MTKINLPKEIYLQNDLNEYFTFEKEEICKGVLFQIYRDDYGMSYHLAWKEPNGEIKEWSCGMCNDYYWDMEDIAEYINKKKEKLNDTNI